MTGQISGTAYLLPMKDVTSHLFPSIFGAAPRGIDIPDMSLPRVEGNDNFLGGSPAKAAGILGGSKSITPSATSVEDPDGFAMLRNEVPAVCWGLGGLRFGLLFLELA